MSLLVEVNNIDLSCESEPYYDNFEMQDKIEAAFKECQVVKITTKDDKINWASKLNFNMGTCGCCSKIEFEEIRNITFYKIEGKSPL